MKDIFKIINKTKMEMVLWQLKYQQLENFYSVKIEIRDKNSLKTRETFLFSLSNIRYSRICVT